MPTQLTRIFSDIHFGDRASSLTRLASLIPLFEGATHLVLNGDTLDTRPSPLPAATPLLRAEILDFFRHSAPPAIFLTGNHDPDISNQHHLDLADGALLVTHGDALFDDLVPWSQDAPTARRLISAELATLSSDDRSALHPRLCAWRRAAAALPQRHQSEPHGLKHLIGFARETVWPPSRIFRVLRAWREAPHRAAAFTQQHRPHARFFAMGHTHRLGVRHSAGITIFNTGSFCPPCPPGVIDLTSDRITLRRVERRGTEFHFGDTLAAFSLARP